MQYTGLAAGAHTLTVSAVKPHLLASVEPVVLRWVVVDLDAPDTTATLESAARIALGDPARFTVTSTEVGSTFECSTDGGATYEPCPDAGAGGVREVTGLDAGETTLLVRAVDGGGNTDPTPAELTWTVVGAPVVSITSGPEPSPALTTTRSATFAFDADQPGATYRCSLDGATAEPCTSGVTFEGLSFADHTFAVVAVNEFGVEGDPVTRTWTVVPPEGAEPPTTTILEAPTSPAGATATFAFSADQPDVTFECRTGAAPGTGWTAWTGCSSPAVYSDLAEGEHVFQVRATNAFGVGGGHSRRAHLDRRPGAGDLILSAPQSRDPGAGGDVRLLVNEATGLRVRARPEAPPAGPEVGQCPATYEVRDLAPGEHTSGSAPSTTPVRPTRHPPATRGPCLEPVDTTSRSSPRD